MQHFSAGGLTRIRILGEVLPNLDQGTHAYELDNILSLKVEDVDGIEAEVTYDGVIDVDDKNKFLLKNVKAMIKK